jgi:hypothetical protein
MQVQSDEKRGDCRLIWIGNRRRSMNNNAIRFILISVLMAFTALFFPAAPAQAQSITIINQSSCIQWLQVYDDGGRLCVACALTPNAQTVRSPGGNGIGRIMGGPTKAVDNCCYKKAIDASTNLSGKTWRIEIQSGLLRVIDGDKGWKEVFSQSANFSSCNFGSAAMGEGGSFGEVPRN